MLRQTLTIKPKIGEGAAKPLYGEPVAYKARIEAKRRQSRDTSGTVRVSDYVAWLRPDAAVAVGDQAVVFSLYARGPQGHRDARPHAARWL